jgi:GNAT superfamily N-acetyltransferase
MHADIAVNHIRGLQVMPAAEIKIRAGGIADGEALSALYAETCRAAHQGIIPHANLELMIAKRVPEWWQRLIAQGTHVQVIELDATLAGYAMYGAGRYGPAGYAGEIYEIYIRPTHQGVGLGSRLLAAAREELARLGHHGVMAWSLADAELACRFLEARGGRAFARSELVYPARTLERIAYGWPADPG